MKVPTHLLPLRPQLDSLLKTRIASVKNTLRLQIAFPFLFLVVLVLVIFTNAFVKGAALGFICFWGLICWYAVKEISKTRERLAWYDGFDMDSYLDFLWRYGETDIVFSELERELNSPVFVGETSSETSRFALTEHWLIDFSLFPAPFAFQYSEIRYVMGRSDSSYGWMPYKYSLIPNRFYFAAILDSTEMRLPFYTASDHVEVIRYLRAKRPNIRIEWPEMYEQYFSSRYDEAVGEEPPR